MKSLLIISLFLLASPVFAQKLELEIVSAEFGVEDEAHNKTLCLTVLRVPESGELLGVVESIQDCFYARLAHRVPNNRLTLDLRFLSPLQYPELMAHLQKLDTQLKFYFSEGD